MLGLLDGTTQLKDATAARDRGATVARMLPAPSHLTEKSDSSVKWRPK
jgi:hypothetical protein